MSAPPYTLRRAVPSDAEVSCKISADTFVETFGHMYPPEDLAAYLADSYTMEKQLALINDPQCAMWLLIENSTGAAVGHALAGPCGLPHVEAVPEVDGEVRRLYVLKTHQNGGHGRTMMTAAMEWLLASGPRVLWLGVLSENLGAQRFYERYGFKKAGEYEFPVGKIRDLSLIHI
eukprot:TRINITY_DN50232_c0_g1_i1.p1 TRINITY_DN50232_c0_g1~~TRINITY_DN50232_c0_g1_i1.p1  ORF type:complete len:175 (+),score=23.38 TRINITY_DN50232_c0_g1_i1:98-622(+)